MAATKGMIDVKEYFAAAGSNFTKKDAAIIGPVLDRLGKEKGAKKGPTAPEIVEEARRPRSPIHPYFEWDDHIAAEQHRLQQARTMASSITVRIVGSSGELHEVRAFQAVRVVTGVSDDPEEMGDAASSLKRYVSVEAIQQDPSLTNQVIQEAERNLMAWRKRYAEHRDVYTRFHRVFEAIDLALDEDVATIS